MLSCWQEEVFGSIEEETEGKEIEIVAMEKFIMGRRIGNFDV